MIEDELMEERDDEFFADEEYVTQERESSRDRRFTVRRRSTAGRDFRDDWAKQRRKKGKPRSRRRD
jgi:hypothetical protein